MKKARGQAGDDPLPEYDFASMKGAVRGKYARKLRAGSNIVVLEPDLVDAFPTSVAVNEALRAVLSVARRRSK